MRRCDLPSIERLRELLRLDPETGKLYWRVNRGTRGRAGREALTSINNSGYRAGIIDGSPLLNHRVAFALHHGRWPEGEVDHINGDPLDNRPGNLREASRHANARNIRSRPGSASRFLGVSWNKGAQKWAATINAFGRHTFLGYYDSEEQAAIAYAYAATLHHGPHSGILRPEATEQRMLMLAHLTI